MVFYPYAIATGWNETDLTYVENLVRYAPVGRPVPLGSTRRQTMNQNVQTNGTVVVTWTFSGMRYVDFNNLIMFIFGGFTTENANVTIQTRKRDETFARYNAVALLPAEGEDYRRRSYGHVQDLVLTFRDLQAI